MFDLIIGIIIIIIIIIGVIIVGVSLTEEEKNPSPYKRRTFELRDLEKQVPTLYNTFKTKSKETRIQQLKEQLDCVWKLSRQLFEEINTYTSINDWKCFDNAPLYDNNLGLKTEYWEYSEQLHSVWKKVCDIYKSLETELKKLEYSNYSINGAKSILNNTSEDCKD
jgi:hypothetical protein